MGLAIPLPNNRLCDCFLEYGEVTSKMAMLLSIILFGAVLSTSLTTLALAPAPLVIVLIRPAVLSLVLGRAHISGAARTLLAWFGPRGLNSLLLALLVVLAGVPNGERTFGIVGVVVLVSVLVHGISATPLAGWYARRAAVETFEEEREGTVAGLFEALPEGVDFISADELRRRIASPDPPLVLDVRSRSDLETDDDSIPGNVRIPPDQVVEWGPTGRGPARS